MAWNGDSSAIFSGASGQMAVIGELLHRKCNAAIPHADVGMDVFAFHDDQEEVARIQVKTAAGKRYAKKSGYKAAFRIPLKQLSRADSPPLFYALVVRLDDAWASFLIIGRNELNDLRVNGCGYENKKSGALELAVVYETDPVKHTETQNAGEQQTPKVSCDSFDLSEYLDAWNLLPPLKLKAEIDVD